MNAKIQSRFVAGLVTSGAFVLLMACAGSSDDDTKPKAGTTATGGAGGNTPASGSTVTFTEGQAKGAMTGYGWVALGRDDKLSSPTCEGKEITKAAPCATKTIWSKPDALCMSGSIPIVVNADYTNNWGVQIGVNVSEPNDQIGKTFTTISAEVSGQPSAQARLMVHRKGDNDETNYCVKYAISGVVVPFTMFETKCWGGESDSVKMTADDVPKIDKVMIQIPSTENAAIPVTELCLSKITFN